MLTESEYHKEISRLADEAIHEAKEGTFGIGEEAREGFLTWLHETIDGHQYVIYTAKSQVVLAISSNDGAYVENFGTDGVVSDGSLNWGALAFAAMEQDLVDEFGTRDDFDVNDPNPEPDEND